MKYSWQLHDTFAKGARAGLITYSLARCTHPRSSSTACFLDNGRVGAFITRAIWHVPAAYGARPQGDLQVVGPPRPVSVRRGTRPGSPRPPQRARRATQASTLCGCNGMRMAGIAVRGCSGQHHISQIEQEGQTTKLPTMLASCVTYGHGMSVALLLLPQDVDSLFVKFAAICFCFILIDDPHPLHLLPL